MDDMQLKVSMVVPCYNKVKHIGTMFDSIIAQHWDNIELVLVNDGSTDGTREIISDYEAQFRERGYSVIIVEQENRGVAAAVYEGLNRVSGDFICQVDADDELDPEYVSDMAGWLTMHPEDEWVACDILFKSATLVRRLVSRPNAAPVSIRHYLSEAIRFEIVTYLFRSRYMQRCCMMDSFYTGSDGSQEPQIAFPLIVGGGNMGYIRKPLYIYHIEQGEIHHSSIDSFERATVYYKGWHNAVFETIKRLHIDDKERRYLLGMTRLREAVCKLSACVSYKISDERLDELSKAVSDMINEMFSPSPHISAQQVRNIRVLHTAINNFFVDRRSEATFVRPQGRIIAWGALGKNAQRILPAIAGTVMEPTHLWDMAGDGEAVVLPETDTLSAQDVVLILTFNPVIERQIIDMLERIGDVRFIRSEDILSLVAPLEFPMFYDGSLTFVGCDNEHATILRKAKARDDNVFKT